ncbi:opacity protein-like surface antigen [Dysgonomonadaceae bacterium PH5-43]|nr:opacity protein-like surface antigen [Dysgonomonadaceae bacterium PH5-43]
MKRLLLIALISVCAFSSNIQAQSNSLTVGAKGAYQSKYKGFLYGLDLSYRVSPLFEVSLSGLMNPKIFNEDKDFNDPAWDRDISFYSGSVDLRFYLINSDLLSTGPSLGAQYINFKSKDMNGITVDDGSLFGFNIGWHAQFMVTENFQINGGWRYTNAKEEQSYHAIYLGVGYTFNLF